MPSYYEKPIPAGRSDDTGGIENYFSILIFFCDNGCCRFYLPPNMVCQQNSAPDPAENNSSCIP
jgi:hypothetical protein